MDDRYAEQKHEELSAKVARLRDIFPWPKQFDIDKGCSADHPKAWHLAEIVRSPEYCIDAMIRVLTEYKTKRGKMNDHDDYCECKKCIDKDRCDHPNADKVDGRWWCGFCGVELDENMEPILVKP